MSKSTKVWVGHTIDEWIDQKTYITEVEVPLAWNGYSDQVPRVAALAEEALGDTTTSWAAGRKTTVRFVAIDGPGGTVAWYVEEIPPKPTRTYKVKEGN